VVTGATEMTLLIAARYSNKKAVVSPGNRAMF